MSTSQYEGPPARRISGTALAVRTLSGQTKLLVPVSAATATARKPNSHKQILVVPTPGGGARLATVANSSSNASILCHTHLHPHHNYSSSGSSGGSRRGSPSFNYNRVGGANESYKSNSASGSRYNGNHDNIHSIDTTQLLRQQQLHQQQLREQYLKLKLEEEKIPEWKRKEDFFAALGLVTKQALKEIQNKKCERKRRTTANPQFSNAAIEAKRINAMEVAAKRAKRREMAASERNASAPLTRIARRNSQMPIVPIQSSSSSTLRSSLRPPTTNSSQPTGTSPSSSTTSFHHKAVFRQFPNSPSTNMTVAPDRSRNLVERLKSRYQLHTTPYQIQRAPNSTPSPSPTVRNKIIVEEISSLVSSKPVNIKPTPPPKAVRSVHNCYACYETCDADLDAIMACVHCQCYFHATCVSSVDEINKTNSVPCPSCDEVTSYTFDGYNSLQPNSEVPQNSNPEKETSKPEEEKPILEEEEGDAEELEEEEEANPMEVVEDNKPPINFQPAKFLTLEEITKLPGGKNPIIVVSKAEFLKNQARNQTQVALKTKENLIIRQSQIAKLINEGKKRYNELAITLNDLKEDKIKLLQERVKIQDCLKKVTNVIKLVNASDVETDQTKVSDKPKAPEESSVADKKPNDTNGIATSCEEKKPTESDSSSSDDDSSDSDDSDDEEDPSNVEKNNSNGIKRSKPNDDQLKEEEEIVNDVTSIEGHEEVIEHEEEDQAHESTISITEEEVGEMSEGDKLLNVPQVVEETVLIDSEMKVDVDNSLDVKVGTVLPEAAQEVSGFRVDDDAMIIEELNLGGDEVLITTEEVDDSNLVILDNESVALDKCSPFDDETSAAVASIQDVLEGDVL